MKKLLNIILILAVLTPTFIMPSEVKAQTFGELKKELAKFEKDYENNKAKQQMTANEIASTKNTIIDISAETEQIGKDIVALKEEIEELNKEIERKDKQIKQLISFTQISNGESAYLEYIFGAQDFTDFIYRLAVAEQLANYNETLIDEYNAKIEENNRKTEELNQKQEELEQKQGELEKLLVKLNAQKQDIQEEAHTIEEEIKMRKEAVALYEEMGCKDDENIKYCGKNALPSNTELFRPVKAGRITSPFGYRIHPINKVKKFHYAIDIGWYYKYGGDPIYSAGAGVVVWVGKKACGNNIVYIHHRLTTGETYTTSYWHMRATYVKVGDVVSKDTQIGIMGGTRQEDTCSTGPHLHFMLAKGLYLIDYTSFNSHAIDPTSVINFPKGKAATDRYIRY